MILFILFITYTIIMGKKKSSIYKENESENETQKGSLLKDIILIIIGIIGLKIGGDLAVNNAVKIAEIFIEGTIYEIDKREYKNMVSTKL